jgi:hypothetical protein
LVDIYCIGVDFFFPRTVLCFLDAWLWLFSVLPPLWWCLCHRMECIGCLKTGICLTRVSFYHCPTSLLSNRAIFYFDGPIVFASRLGVIVRGKLFGPRSCLLWWSGNQGVYFRCSTYIWHLCYIVHFSPISNRLEQRHI